MPPDRAHTGDVYINRAFTQPRQPLHCHGGFFGTRLILAMTPMKGSVRPQKKGTASHCAMGLVEKDKGIEKAPIHKKGHSCSISHSTLSNLIVVTTVSSFPKWPTAGLR